MTIPSTPPEIGASTGYVQSVMADAQTLAAQSVSRGLAAIQTLGNFQATIPPIVAPNFVIPTITLSPTATPPSLGDVPLYDLVAPLLVDIPLPNPLTAIAPAAPSLNIVATPVAPNFTLPAVPTFASLYVPNAPTLDLPLFVDAAPIAPIAPNAVFT